MIVSFQCNGPNYSNRVLIDPNLSVLELNLFGKIKFDFFKIPKSIFLIVVLFI